MIIALDGPDGAGKSTQVKLLREWADLHGLRCEVANKWRVLGPDAPAETRFLRGTVLEELRVCIAEMEAPARSLFLMWLIASALPRDDVDLVVFDGFWVKHSVAEAAYDPASGPLWQALVPLLPVPDLTIILDVTPEEALRRKGTDLTPYECGRGAEPSAAGFLRHQARVRDGILALARSRSWPVLGHVDPSHTAHEIQRLVRGLQLTGSGAHAR